jgi:hypothetical protein
MPENGRIPRWRDFLKFINALRNQVVALVCGGILTAALAVAQGLGLQVKPAFYGVVLGVFFLIAEFGAWFEERRDVETLRGLYGLSLSIEQVVSPLRYRHKGDDRQLCALLMIVRINNSGAPTSLTGWRASLTPSPEDADVRLRPALIGRDVDFGESVQYDPEDDLMQKTAETPVAQGSIMHGVILCLGDAAILDSLKAGATTSLSCFDVVGTLYESSFSLTIPEEAPAFFPGLGRGDSVRARNKSEQTPVVTVVRKESSGIPSVFDVPSIVIAFHLGEEEYDDDTGEPYSPELLSFTNIGREPATNLSLSPIDIAGRRITVPEVPVLVANGPAADVRVFGLTSALFRARKKMPTPARGSEALPIRVKLTLAGGTSYQHEGLQWEYALTERPYGNITIKRINPGSQQEWTAFDSLDGE